MIIIGVNGAINSGKSTISKRLNSELNNSLFIEVDELLSEDESENLKLDFMQGVNERLARLNHKLKKLIDENLHDYLIFAYPLTEQNYENIKKIIPKPIKFIVITLRPPLSICQTNRGTRILDDWERNRIKEMYAMDITRLRYSDLFIDNSTLSLAQTVALIKKQIEF